MHVAALWGISRMDQLFVWLNDVFQSEVAKYTISFMVAARMHRAWVKKDMGEQFGRITASIDNVADKLTLELISHTKEIKGLSARVDNLEAKIK